MFACEIKGAFDCKMEIEGEFNFLISFFFFCWYHKINEDLSPPKTQDPENHTLTCLIGQVWKYLLASLILDYCGFFYLLLHPNINHSPTFYNLKSSQSPKITRVSQDIRSTYHVHEVQTVKILFFFCLMKLSSLLVMKFAQTCFRKCAMFEKKLFLEF